VIPSEREVKRRRSHHQSHCAKIALDVNVVLEFQKIDKKP